MYQKKTVIVLLLISAVLSAYITSFFYNRKLNFNEYPHIAILNGMLLKKNAKCFNLHNEIENRRSEILHNLNKEEMKIKQEFKQITQNKKLNTTKKQLHILELEKKWKNTVQTYDNKLQNVKDLENKLTATIQSSLDKILNKIAKQLSITTILNKETELVTFVFFNKENIDITNLVIDELDKDLNLKALETMKM